MRKSIAFDGIADSPFGALGDLLLIPETFVPVYHAHKVSEIEHVSAMDVDECCRAYDQTY